MGFLKGRRQSLKTSVKEEEVGRESAVRTVTLFSQMSLIYFPCTVPWNLPVCLVLNPTKD